MALQNDWNRPKFLELLPFSLGIQPQSGYQIKGGGVLKGFELTQFYEENLFTATYYRILFQLQLVLSHSPLPWGPERDLRVKTMV